MNVRHTFDEFPITEKREKEGRREGTDKRGKEEISYGCHFSSNETIPV